MNPLMFRHPAQKSDESGHDIIDVASSAGWDKLASTSGTTAELPERPNDKPESLQPQNKTGEDELKDGDDPKDDGEKARIWDKLRQHKIAVLITIVILVIVIAGVIIWYLNARHFESTDDAFIDGRPVAISPEVTGNIVNVPVTDNQLVHAGDLLAEIDPRDFQAALQLAQAQIEQAQASIENSLAQIESQKAQVNAAEKQVDEAQAALSFSHDQDVRAQDLVQRGAGTVQNAQQTASDLISKQAALDAAIASRISAQRQIDVLNAQVKSNEAQLGQSRAQKAMADANLTRTQLHATVDSRVTRLTAAVGAIASEGQALMVLVPLELWVTANFKETQLADMRPGQPVDIEIDSYGKTYPGHVASLQAGSGTAFSLLPAENATGNYVKVVQRIPVKLTFDKLPDVEIGPGMSVVPSVRVR
jgi:membrane fusion protein (multidrug efflux system)